MTPYLHSTTGDTLWFAGWVPRSRGAMIGTCIGLFILSIVERSLSAFLAVLDIHWAKRMIEPNGFESIPTSSSLAELNELDSSSCSRSETLRLSARESRKGWTDSIPPFLWRYDVPRGIIFAVVASLNFAFMLAAMTFQVNFIVTLVIGHGVGEAFFGRFTGISKQTW